MARSSTSFQPGTSGNPRGRPRGSYGWRRRVFERAVAEVRERDRLAPETAEELIERALAGELGAVRRILDAIEDAQWAAEVAAAYVDEADAEPC
jgi:Family of unknown function (DUF5681)